MYVFVHDTPWGSSTGYNYCTEIFVTPNTVVSLYLVLRVRSSLINSESENGHKHN